MQQLLKSDTSRAIVFLMVDSADHLTGKTGLTPTVTISKNGGSFASPSGTVAEVAHGVYKLTPASGDVDTVGVLALHATGTGADAVDVFCQVGAIAQQVFDEATANHTTAGSFGEQLQPLRQATAQTGSSTTIRLDASASATSDFYNGCEVYILSGTGANQQRTIVDYDGTTKDATVNFPWVVTPDNTSVFAVYVNGELPMLNEKISTYTLSQIFGWMAAVLLGKSSGADSGTEIFRDLDDTTNKVVATMSGKNRTAVSRN